MEPNQCRLSTPSPGTRTFIPYPNSVSQLHILNLKYLDEPKDP